VAILVLLLVMGEGAVASQLRPPAALDACALLTADEISAVQQAAVKEQKAGASASRAVNFAQCLFATAEFARSVSLTVISDGARPGSARVYWSETFDPTRRIAKKHPLRRVADVGQEAFWTGDARAGTLYVLHDGVVLRISVGGVNDVEERLRRSRVLALTALKRLAARQS
jgi:hypothetical protein